MAFIPNVPAFPKHQPYVRKSNPQKPLTVDQLIIHLVKMGYRYYLPLSPTWSDAFVLKQAGDVLCILIRKNGIDLRLYTSYTEGVNIIDNRKIAMHGGGLYRNHFYGSKTLITGRIRKIAAHFARGKILDVVKEENGCSYRLKPDFANIKNLANKRFRDKYNGMVDAKEARQISEYIRNDCGGYLGGGEWT